MPKVDKENNEPGGIRNTTLLAALGTYTGLSLRQKGYVEGDLNTLNGMFIPFPITQKERLKPGDQRPSHEERYKLYEGYVAVVRKAAGELLRQGFLLPEDAAWIIQTANESNVLSNKLSVILSSAAIHEIYRPSDTESIAHAFKPFIT